MLAGEYCNRDIAIIGRADSVAKAAKLMREHHVSEVLVVDLHNGESMPVGILTDRDIIIGVLAEEMDVNVVKMDEVMNSKLITAKESDDLMATNKRMRLNGVSRLPIVNQLGGLVGVLSVDNMLGVITEQMIDIDQINSREMSKERGLQPVTIKSRYGS